MSSSFFESIVGGSSAFTELGRLCVSESMTVTTMGVKHATEVSKNAAVIIAKHAEVPNALFVFNYLRVTPDQYHQITEAIFKMIQTKK